MLGVVYAELSDSETTIGKGCFWYSRLEKFSVPASVLGIEEETFYGCEKLKEV